jgi:hypothetical protein
VRKVEFVRWGLRQFLSELVEPGDGGVVRHAEKKR